MTPEELKIIQSRLEKKGVAQQSEAPASNQSKLEAKFLELWNACGGPVIQCECYVCQNRKWRFDFAHLQSRTGIEIDGGVWLPGGHNMGGKIRDCEKDFEAVMNGWRVIRLVPQQITVETIERLIAFVRGI